MSMELGVENINQAIVLDLLLNASSWAEPVVYEDEVYYWVARQAVCSQLPFLKLKPDTVYRHYKKLLELGLIDYIKVGKKDCTRPTELGKSYQFAMSEIDPSKLGNRSENNSEIDPTYKTTKTDIKVISNKGAHAFSEQMQEFGVDENFIEAILKHRREIKSKKPTPKAMRLILKGMWTTVDDGILKSMEDCLKHYTEETTWQSFKPEYLASSNQQKKKGDFTFAGAAEQARRIAERRANR